MASWQEIEQQWAEVWGEAFGFAQELGVFDDPLVAEAGRSAVDHAMSIGGSEADEIGNWVRYHNDPAYHAQVVLVGRWLLWALTDLDRRVRAG